MYVVCVCHVCHVCRLCARDTNVMLRPGFVVTCTYDKLSLHVNNDLMTFSTVTYINTHKVIMDFPKTVMWNLVVGHRQIWTHHNSMTSYQKRKVQQQQIVSKLKKTIKTRAQCNIGPAMGGASISDNTSTISQTQSCISTVDTLNSLQ